MWIGFLISGGVGGGSAGALAASTALPGMATLLLGACAAIVTLVAHAVILTRLGM